MSTTYNKVYKFKKENSREFKDVFLAKKEPDFHILTNTQFVEEVPQSRPFTVPDTSISALEAAKIIRNALPNGQPITYYDDEIGMWEWFSYAFSLLLKDTAKGGKLGAINRYSPVKRPPNGDWKTFMRHQLRSAAYLYDCFGNNSKIYLFNPIGIGGEMREHTLQTFPLVNQKICELLNKILWDKKEKTAKNGFGDKDPENGYGVRFIVASLKRLRVTYNLESMDVDEIIKLLPQKVKDHYGV